MIHNITFKISSSETIENALGKCIEEIRLKRNITQNRLAREAGVSRSTITRLSQEGKGISLDSFIRILKALRLEENLGVILPDPGISPLEELERGNRPPRQRARTRKQHRRKWTWQDDDAVS